MSAITPARQLKRLLEHRLGTDPNWAARELKVFVIEPAVHVVSEQGLGFFSRPWIVRDEIEAAQAIPLIIRDLLEELATVPRQRPESTRRAGLKTLRETRVSCPECSSEDLQAYPSGGRTAVFVCPLRHFSRWLRLPPPEVSTQVLIAITEEEAERLSLKR